VMVDKGVMHPITFDTCWMDTILVRLVTRVAIAWMSRHPFSTLSGMNLRTAPFSSASNCHGTILLWCSSSVIRISSPFSTFALPYVDASRFRLSVAPEVKIISSREGALRKDLSLSRDASYCSVAERERACAPRWTFELEVW